MRRASGSEPAGTVRAGVAAGIRAYLARYPAVSFDRLAAAAGLEPARFADADAWIEQDRWVVLLESIAGATGNAAWAIEYAMELPWKDLGVLGYVIQHSPTFGAALDNSARYLAVQQTGGRLVLDANAATARVTYAMADPRIVEFGRNAESVFALIVRVARELAGVPTWAPREVAFAHAAPDAVGLHERYFRAPVRFGRATNTLVFSAGELGAPLVTADAGLLPFLLRHAEECLTRMPAAAPFSDEVRRAVMVAISAGEPSIEEVAARLGASARSVQRRLHDDGQSFKAIVEASRLALAQRYLADPALSLTETAFLLGYSELSAFSRAFRRWTGKTALERRRELVR
jgi:AraC-like DNA-binding protein